MISEKNRLIEPSDVPSQLIIDLDFWPHHLEIDASNGNLNFIFDIELQRNSGEIPIGSDMIHVSGGDAERDFEDDHLALPKLSWSTLSRLIYFNPRNLEKLRRIYQSKLLN